MGDLPKLLLDLPGLEVLDYLPGWWSFGLAVLGLVLLGLLLVLWLSRPVRYRGLRFAEFSELLGPWFLQIDRRGRIFITPEREPLPKLCFRAVGRGPGKRIRIDLPAKQAGTALLSDLESLAVPFSGVSLIDCSEAIELTFPAHAPYAVSVATRAVETLYRSLGGTNHSTFAIHAMEGDAPIDPSFLADLRNRGGKSAA